MDIYAYAGNDPINLTDPSGLCDSAQRGSAKADFSLMGFVDTGGPVTAATPSIPGAGLGTAAAAGRVAAAIGLYPTSTQSQQADEQRQFVARAGLAAASSLQTGTAMTTNGFGFSVQTSPGVAPDELARNAANIERYRQYSVTTVQQLQAIPGVIVNFPTPGYGMYHGTVSVPYPPPPGIFQTIQGQFQHFLNPYFRPTP